MGTLASILSYASGFALMRYHEAPAQLIATSLAINLALTPLIAVIASRRGRSVFAWAVLGLGFGMWALAAVLLMGHVRNPGKSPSSSLPPTSDAA
jgi:hypothetical protein